MEQQVIDPAAASAGAAPPSVTLVTPSTSDPFALDEAALASFSPEQRAALSPVLDGWKKKATEEIEKRSKSYDEKIKPVQEKAEALDQLVKDPRFQQWYVNIQKAASSQATTPDQQAAINQAKPQDFATPEEWQQAIFDASSGNGEKLRQIQERMFSVMATPVVQQLNAKQRELELTMAMKDLFDRHADAKDLDAIGRDPNDSKSPSLFEVAMHYAVDIRKGTLEDGYKLAKSWADGLGKNAQAAAMGLVQNKREAVMGTSSTQNANQSVVEVGSTDELIQKNMEALLSGQKPPRFVVRA